MYDYERYNETRTPKTQTSSLESPKITELYVFEIEPWRTLGKRPFSMNRENDPEESNPFVFPVIETHLEPYFDYDTYEPPELSETREPYNLRSLPRCEPIS